MTIKEIGKTIYFSPRMVDQVVCTLYRFVQGQDFAEMQLTHIYDGTIIGNLVYAGRPLITVNIIVEGCADAGEVARIDFSLHEWAESAPAVLLALEKELLKTIRAFQEYNLARLEIETWSG